MSDLTRIDQMQEKDIDYSDIPPLDESFFTKPTVELAHKKDKITLTIDHDVLLFFQNQSNEYKNLMNTVLKAYVTAQQKKDPPHKNL